MYASTSFQDNNNGKGAPLVMNPVSAPYQHRCCVCRRKQPEVGANLAWFHPVCAQVICSRCQFQDNKMKAVNANQPCPDSKCLYHQDKDKASILCPWPSRHPHGSRIIAPALPMLISQDAISNLESKEGTDLPGRVDTIATLASISKSLENGNRSAIATSQLFYELCGNCHKQGDIHRIMSVDLECVLGMCALCFAFPEGHDDHARDKLLRLADKGIVATELLRLMTEVLTTDVVKRVDSAYCSDMAIKAAHKKGEGNAEEGKALEVIVKPIIQSFIQRMRQIQRCGDALLSMYNELQLAYNEVRMMMRPGDNTSEPTSEPSDSSSPLADTESKSSPEDNKLVQFLLNEGKNAIEDILSRLEGMVAQRKMLSDTLDYVLMLLGLPSTTLSIGEKDKGEEGEQETIKVIQDAFKKIDISCSKHASKAILIVRTFKGIRGIIEGDDISFELDIDGLDGLGLKEGVKEIIILLQNIDKHLHSPQYDEEVERVKANVIEKCDTVSKMLTMEAVYSAMEQAFVRNEANRHLNEGLDYMLAEGGKAYDGAKAMTAFDLAITFGSKEAMFRRAQMLLDGRAGVKRDAELAVTLFEKLKAQGLYLPQIYYYLAKHVLEGSLGRTAETYKLASEYFTKIIEMNYDDDNSANDNHEGEERKGGGVDKNDNRHQGPNSGVDYVPTSKNVNSVDNDIKKAAALFAQAGMYYIYATEHDDQKPYFRRQLPSSIRQWLRVNNLLDLCLQAKEAGCKEPELHSMLGYGYFLYNQREEESKAAIENLTKACSLGISSAMHTFGNVYAPGFNGVLDCPKDPKKALSYYLQAEAIGYYDGGRLYTDIAHLFWDREDDEKDGNKALEYFDLAIRHGDEEGYFWKARLYDPEAPPCPPVKQCAKTAHKLRLAAKVAGSRDPYLYDAISDDYSLGRGVRKDGSKAVYYLGKSIQYGGQRKYQWLGKLYDSAAFADLPNIKKDDAQALNCYLKEAKMEVDEDGFDLPPHEPWLFSLIGSMYEKDRGIPIDYYTAGEYYKKAGEEGVEGLTRLGKLYDTAHTDVPYPSKDDVEARRYYEAADILNTTQGDVPTYLGNMYRDGRGGDVDGVKAMKCYAKAVNLGWYDALYEKAIIFDPEQKVCPPYEKDEERAVELYLTAEAAGVKSKELMLSLANCFEQGRYVKKDENRAKDYERRAGT